MYTIVTCESPADLHNIIDEMTTEHSHGTRAASTYITPIPYCKKEITKLSFFPVLLSIYYQVLK